MANQGIGFNGSTPRRTGWILNPAINTVEVIKYKTLTPRPPLPLSETADLISRTAIAAVVCLKTGANAHRLILFAENGLNQQSPKAMGVEISTVELVTIGA